MAADRSALIIGGGLIGCSSAWYLQQLGWKITLLERDRIGSGASNGNCGFVCPSHALPLSGPGVIGKTLPHVFQRDAALSIPVRFDPELWKWLLNFSRQCTHDRMMQAAVARNALLASSVALYRELLSEQTIDCDWQNEGLLLVFNQEEAFWQYERTAELLERAFSIASTPYEKETIRELEPALRAGLAGGWHFPQDAHVRPDKLTASLKTAIVRRGGEIGEGVEVVELRTSRNAIEAVETTSGSYSPDLIVLAAGAETPKFSDAVGCKIPIQPGKGYSFTMRAPEPSPRIPMIFEEHHVAVTPLHDSFRVGSTMEFTGYDRKLSPRRLALLRRSAEDHLGAQLPEATEEWTGWRPMVYDGLPCIGRAPGAENLIVAAGNGMIGLATAPATGKLVSELASELPTHIESSPYSLTRFQ